MTTEWTTYLCELMEMHGVFEMPANTSLTLAGSSALETKQVQHCSFPRGVRLPPENTTDVRRKKRDANISALETRDDKQLNTY